MRRSKSGLFLMELIIIIAFFAIASSICVQLFAMSHTLSVRSMGIKMAVMHAGSAAESFKATNGDFELMAEILQVTEQSEGRLLMAFDEGWNRTNGDSRFEMSIEADLTAVPAIAAIIVMDHLHEEELYSLTVKRYLGR